MRDCWSDLEQWFSSRWDLDMLEGLIVRLMREVRRLYVFREFRSDITNSGSREKATKLELYEAIVPLSNIVREKISRAELDL